MGGGLNRVTVSEKKIRFYAFINHLKDQGSISDNYINSVYEDKNKNLWISTYGNGLNKISLADAGSDHQLLATLSGELAVAQSKVSVAEENWLVLAAEAEEIGL